MAEPGRGEADLNDRLDFIGMGQQQRAALRKLQPLLDRAIEPALSAFCDKVKTTAGTREFFADNGHMAAATGFQKSHWATIAAADFGRDYAGKAREVGQAHGRIGLEPRWYIGGYALVVEQLIHAIVKDQWPSLLQMHKRRPEDLAQGLSSLVKAALLDIDLGISVYLETLDELRRRADRGLAECPPFPRGRESAQVPC